MERQTLKRNLLSRVSFPNRNVYIGRVSFPNAGWLREVISHSYNSSISMGVGQSIEECSQLQLNEST